MKISINGINFIKSFEGFRATSYRAVPSEKYLTIGYGHYGIDVLENMIITKEQAEKLLVTDLHKFENYVNTDCGYLDLNQNQYDSLVSFTYNCGRANLKKLIKNRNKEEIAEALLLYNKAGGKVLEGLKRRRKAERDLFLTVDNYVDNVDNSVYYEVVKGDSLWTIAVKQLGAGARWKEIYDLNELTTTILKIGQRLKLPTK